MKLNSNILVIQFIKNFKYNVNEKIKDKNF